MKSVISGLLVALSMYSAIPVPQVNWEKQTMRWALGFLPLIGVLIGAIEWFWFAFCVHFGAAGVFYAVIAALIPLAVSGGIHLDGLCDTCDALCSFGDREKRLAILKDPPPKPKDAESDKNLLQLAFRTRIKLFYRPSGLKGEPAEAPAKLTWKLNNAQLQVNNPTPYYVSFNDVAIESGGKSYKVDSSMVAPFGQVSFAVTDIASSVSSGKVIYKAINDYGGNIDGSTSL